MFKEPKPLGQIIKQMINEEVNKRKSLDIFLVTDVQKDKYTVNIVNTIQNTLQYSNVPVVGLGLGNFKGIMRLPDVGDYVIVGFLDVRTPIVLGTIYGSQDVIPTIDAGGTLIAGQRQGCYIYFDKEDNIKITNKEVTITLKDNTVNIDGSFIYLNGSTYRVARVGDPVLVSGTSGIIIDGSPTVKTG